MTSHKYLNKKKGAAYTFFSGLQSAILPAVILAVIESLIFAAVPASGLSSEKKGLGPLSTKKLSDSIKFVTSILEEPGAAIAFCVAIALLCIFTAVILLRFMADKRTVNVYYSLGIKRHTLFLSRYFAGAVMITAATIIPIVAGFFVNLTFLKLSWQLSIVYIHLFFGLWILSLLAYSLSAAVFSSVGTVSEGIVYSLGVMALPTILLVSLENMLSAFVPSSTFDAQIVAFDSSGYFQSISAQSLIFRYERYNPLLFFADEFHKYARGAILSSGGIELTDESAWDNHAQERLYVKDILKADRNRAVNVNASLEDLFLMAQNQNFVPVTDDLGSFIGIVTRRDILQYYYKLTHPEIAQKQEQAAAANAEGV